MRIAVVVFSLYLSSFTFTSVDRKGQNTSVNKKGALFFLFRGSHAPSGLEVLRFQARSNDKVREKKKKKKGKSKEKSMGEKLALSVAAHSIVLINGLLLMW